MYKTQKLIPGKNKLLKIHMHDFCIKNQYFHVLNNSRKNIFTVLGHGQIHVNRTSGFRLRPNYTTGGSVFWPQPEPLGSIYIIFTP